MSKRKSVWLTDDRPRYEPLTNRVTADVVVVGAGITGLTAALLLQRQGREVVVVEANQVGSGTTGGTTGKVTSQHSLLYARLVRQHGVEVAQTYARANQEAIDMVEDLVAETSADCGFTRASAFVYAVDEDDLPSLAGSTKWLAGSGSHPGSLLPPTFPSMLPVPSNSATRPTSIRFVIAMPSPGSSPGSAGGSSRGRAFVTSPRIEPG
jgi:hypothetical protein